jgi:monovalent cation:H+ antiporter, CPA1 family
VLSMLIVGVSLAWLTPLTLASAFLFGALISATDPVAVVALFEKLGVPPRLKMLVDGESMLNDATAIVAFTVVMGIIRSGNFRAGILGQALVNVILVLLGGVLVGVVLGLLMRFILEAAKTNPTIQFAVTLVIAYFAFLIADAFQASGVVAVLSAGLMLGRYKADSLKTEIKVRLDDFWGLAATLANSLIFLLVGLTAARFFSGPLANHTASPWASIFWAIVAAIVARGVMIFTFTPCMNPFLKEGPIDLRYQMISFWGGLRGAVALALALSLAPDFPQQELLVALTLGVALFTMVIGGLTSGPLIHRLELDQPEPVARLEEAQARFLAQRRATQRLGELRVWQPFFPEAFASSEQFYGAQLQQATQELFKTWKALGSNPDLTTQTVWQQALQLERWDYQEVHDQNLISKKTFDRLVLMLDLRDEALRAGQIPPPVMRSDALKSSLEEELVKFLERLWFRQRRASGAGKRARREHYEFDLAVSFISKRVAEGVRQLSQQLAGEIAPAAFESCAAWYAGLSQEMFQHLKAQEGAHPELFQAIQQHVLRQAIQVSAQEKLIKLCGDGIVSGAVMEKLTEKWESE